jgi:hypothetical protein
MCITWLKPAAESEKGFELQPEEIDSFYLPIPEQIATGLNFPPTVIAGIMTIPIHYTNHFRSSQLEVISHALTALLVPFHWLWVISTTFSAQKPRRKLSIYVKACIIIGLVLLTILAVLMLSIVLISVLRNNYYSIIRDFFYLVWFVWGIWILIARLRKHWSNIGTGQLLSNADSRVEARDAEN